MHGSAETQRRLVTSVLLIATCVAACSTTSKCRVRDEAAPSPTDSSDRTSAQISTGDGDCPYGIAETETGCEAFQSVSASETYACGILEEGGLTCWGDRRVAVSDLPTGEFRALSTSRTYACAVDGDGAIDCWGADGGEVDVPTSGPYRDIAVAQRRRSRVANQERSSTQLRGCAVAEGGALDCWGLEGSLPGTDESAAEVAVSSDIACLRTESGSVHCSGGGIEFPEGPYDDIGVAEHSACALKRDGNIICRGSGPVSELESPDGSFRTVGAADRFACGLRPNGSLDCWGIVLDVPRGSYEQLSVGRGYNCALREDGAVRCWGDAVTGVTRTPEGSFEAVAAGPGFNCAVAKGGALRCWGRTPPETSGDERFRQVAASGAGVCAISTDGEARCWVPTVGTAVPEALAGRTIEQIDPGLKHVCAIDATGEVSCWGSKVSGETDPPEGTFSQVAAGKYFSCGLDADGAVVCWGSIDDPPDGTFVALTGGRHHACARSPDGRVECWGRNESGETDVPSTTFRSVDAGGAHTCGVARDGSVACWGNDERGQATPPSGSFQSVHAGGRHSCGIRSSGRVDCWGGAPTFAIPSDEWPEARRNCHTRLFWTLDYPVDGSGSREGWHPGPHTDVWRRRGPVPTAPPDMALSEPDLYGSGEPIFVRTKTSVYVDGRLQESDSNAETDRIRRIRARLEARVRSGRRVREQTDGSERPPSPAVVWVHPESTARQVLRDVELVEQAVAKTPLRELQESGVLLAVEKGGGERPSSSGDAPSWLSDRIERIRQLRWNASGRDPESAEWNRLLDDAFARAVGDCEVARKFGASRFVSESSRFARDAQSRLRFGHTSRALASCGCDALDVPALRGLQFYTRGRWHRPITALRTGPDRDIGAHTYDPDASPLEVDVSADATLQGLIDALADAGFRGDRPVDVTFVDE